MSGAGMAAAGEGRILDFLAGFAEYLRGNGFAVPESGLRNLLLMLAADGVDLTDEEAAVPALSVTLAKDPSQFAAMRELLHHFLEHQEIPAKMREMEEQLRAHQAGNAKEMKDLDEAVRRLKAEKERIGKDKQGDGQKGPSEAGPVLKAAKAKKMRAAMEGFQAADAQAREVVRQALGGEPVTVTGTGISTAQQELAKAAEAAIRAGEAAKAIAMMELAKALKKAESMERDEAEKARRKVEAEKQKKEQEIREAEAARRKVQQEYQLAQARIQERLRQLREETQAPSLTVKGRPVGHRPEFRGKSAAQAYAADIQGLEEKTFNSLTDQEKQRIYRYIKDNLLAFKTRMARNIHEARHTDVDMEKTVQESIRTGGVPVRLFKKTPRRSKADLVLVLDVSGSCKAASEMMLTFIGILKEVFPRGCKAFAFVNSLYDISSIYEAGDTRQAVRETLAMIPQAGQYSNYEKPLRSLWEEHRKDITRDSMVIFIGDARNNRNPTGEEYLKNICRKAKRAYWLNTETEAKWDKADSLASLYGKYAKMYETTDVGELLGFIGEMR